MLMSDPHARKLPSSAKKATYDQFKKSFKKKIRHFEAPSVWIDTLPTTPQEFKLKYPELYAEVYDAGDEPVQARCDLPALNVINRSFKCRGIGPMSGKETPEEQNFVALMQQFIALQQQNMAMMMGPQSHAHAGARRGLRALADPPPPPAEESPEQIGLKIYADAAPGRRMLQADLAPAGIPAQQELVDQGALVPSAPPFAAAAAAAAAAGSAASAHNHHAIVPYAQRGAEVVSGAPSQLGATGAFERPALSTARSASALWDSQLYPFGAAAPSASHFHGAHSQVTLRQASEPAAWCGAPDQLGAFGALGGASAQWESQQSSFGAPAHAAQHAHSAYSQTAQRQASETAAPHGAVADHSKLATAGAAATAPAASRGAPAAGAQLTQSAESALCAPRGASAPDAPRVETGGATGQTLQVLLDFQRMDMETRASRRLRSKTPAPKAAGKAHAKKGAAATRLAAAEASQIVLAQGPPGEAPASHLGSGVAGGADAFPGGCAIQQRKRTRPEPSAAAAPTGKKGKPQNIEHQRSISTFVVRFGFGHGTKSFKYTAGDAASQEKARADAEACLITWKKANEEIE